MSPSDPMGRAFPGLAPSLTADFRVKFVGLSKNQSPNSSTRSSTHRKPRSHVVPRVRQQQRHARIRPRSLSGTPFARPLGAATQGTHARRGRIDAASLSVGDPTGIRTPVTAVKGRCPRPLDDGVARRTRGCQTARRVSRADSTKPRPQRVPARNGPSKQAMCRMSSHLPSN